MSAVSGTRRAIKELVDGTIRVQIDIDPAHRKQFFESFSDIDMPVALAPLNPKAMNAAPAEPEKEKLGKNCSLAVRWCDDVQFQSWLFRKYNVSELVEVHKFMGQPTNIYAKAIVCKLCGIKTRKDLDPDDTEAANRFQTLIRLPYMKYQQTGVIE